LREIKRAAQGRVDDYVPIFNHRSNLTSISPQTSPSIWWIPDCSVPRSYAAVFKRLPRRVDGSDAMAELRHMNFTVRCTIAADHPSLPGHFPAAPIVPGVVILDEILAALTKWREDCQLTVIRAVKFLVPLKPEQPFTICLSADKNVEGKVDFCCRIEDRVIVEGRLQVGCRGKPLP
jgi:3-hydroxyacyl-[acyl-carrier-protein] dehydratase